MSITLAETPALPREENLPAPEPWRAVALRGVVWRAFQLIGEALRDRRGFQLRYDRGMLEIRTKSLRHEKTGYRAARLVKIVAKARRAGYV